MSSIVQSTEFISAMVGAFGGAIAAFLLQAFYEFKKERDQQHASIIEAQYILCVQRNDLENLLQQHLNALRSLPSPERASRLQRLQYPFTELRVSARDLIFLAADKYPNELNDVLIAQSSFVNTTRWLETVNRTKEEIQNASTFVGMTGAGGMAHYGIPKAVVPKILNLNQGVDHLYTAVDAACEKLEASIETLAKIGKEVLMERGFLHYTSSSPHKRANRDQVFPAI